MNTKKLAGKRAEIRTAAGIGECAGVEAETD